MTTRCPECKHVPDFHAEVDDHPPRLPVAGDLSVCLFCGAFLQFGKTLALEILPLDELRELDNEQVSLMNHLRESVIRRRQGQALH